MKHAEVSSGALQIVVVRPQCRAGREQHGSKQMYINIADAAAKQAATFDQLQNFIGCGDIGLRQELKLAHDGIARSQGPERQLADDEGMNQDFARLEQRH